MNPAGGKREGAGRKPRADTPADERVMLRLTTDEQAQIAAAAERRHMTVSEFVRDAALKAARKVLR